MKQESRHNILENLMQIPRLDMLSGIRTRGVLGFCDPDVHFLDNHWTMFIGGLSTRFRNEIFMARLPEGSGLSSRNWTLQGDSQGVARPIVKPRSRSVWDRYGMHSPSFVSAGSVGSERIYYAGRETRQHNGPKSRYSIGVLTRGEGGWQHREKPIFRGSSFRPSVLEPTAIFADGMYRLWYQATPHEIGPGELPDYQLEYRESKDGLTGWSEPVVFSSPEEGFFNNAISFIEGNYWMVLARGTNLHGRPNFPPQGLWLLHSGEPTGNRVHWSSPKKILSVTADSPVWMRSGVCSPSLPFAASAACQNVFFSGTSQHVGWLKTALKQMYRGKPLPVPSPYYLATGSGEIKLTQFRPDRLD